MTEPIEMEIVPPDDKLTERDRELATRESAPRPKISVAKNLKEAITPDKAKLNYYAATLRNSTPTLIDVATLDELHLRVNQLAEWCEGKAQND